MTVTLKQLNELLKPLDLQAELKNQGQAYHIKTNKGGFNYYPNSDKWHKSGGKTKVGVVGLVEELKALGAVQKGKPETVEDKIVKFFRNVDGLMHDPKVALYLAEYLKNTDPFEIGDEWECLLDGMDLAVDVNIYSDREYGSGKNELNVVCNPLFTDPVNKELTIDHESVIGRATISIMTLSQIIKGEI